MQKSKINWTITKALLLGLFIWHISIFIANAIQGPLFLTFIILMPGPLITSYLAPKLKIVLGISIAIIFAFELSLLSSLTAIGLSLSPWSATTLTLHLINYMPKCILSAILGTAFSQIAAEVKQYKIDGCNDSQEKLR